MSLLVIGYQIVIFLIVYMSRGNVFVTGAAIVWTLTHIFVPWLMAIQLFIVACGFIAGRGKKMEDEGR